MINTPLLRKTLEHITAHRRSWQQESWAEVLTRPIASGIRVLEQGELPARFVTADGTDVATDPVTRYLDRHGEVVQMNFDQCGTAACLAGHVVVGDGLPMVFDGNYAAWTVVEDGYVAVPTYARDRLGLTRDQAAELFDGDNTLYALWRIASKFTDGDIEIPDEVKGPDDHDDEED